MHSPRGFKSSKRGSRVPGGCERFFPCHPNDVVVGGRDITVKSWNEKKKKSIFNPREMDGKRKICRLEYFRKTDFGRAESERHKNVGASCEFDILERPSRKSPIENAIKSGNNVRYWSDKQIGASL